MEARAVRVLDPDDDGSARSTAALQTIASLARAAAAPRLRRQFLASVLPVGAFLAVLAICAAIMVWGRG